MKTRTPNYFHIIYHIISNNCSSNFSLAVILVFAHWILVFAHCSELYRICLQLLENLESNNMVVIYILSSTVCASRFLIVVVETFRDLEIMLWCCPYVSDFKNYTPSVTKFKFNQNKSSKLKAFSSRRNQVESNLFKNDLLFIPMFVLCMLCMCILPHSTSTFKIIKLFNLSLSTIILRHQFQFTSEFA